jgi:hypothetical protein
LPAGIDCFTPELIAIISEQLGCDDILNLRLGNRFLRDSSLMFFINRFFRRRVHLLSRPSLLVLLDISRHPFFGPSIKTVVISPDHLTPDRLHDELHSSPYWDWAPDSQSAKEREEYQRRIIEQNYFQLTGLDTAYLTRISLNASNCRSVFVDDRERPWGAAITKRETGLYPSSSIESDYSKIYLRKTVLTVFTAVSASEVPITTLGIKNGNERVHVHPRMLLLPASCLDHVPWVATLTMLQLTLDPGYEDVPQIWSKPLGEFIMHFPHLECLDLYFDTRVEQPSFNVLSQAIHLPRLRSLKLAGVNCILEDLLNLFSNHRSTLREICLEIVGISSRTGGSWETLLAEIRDRIQITRFKMMQCDVDGEDVCFEEYGIDQAYVIDVMGEDPRLLDRLINGIKKGRTSPGAGTFVIDNI